MNCPACGLYHPAFYERCIACGVALKADNSQNQHTAGESNTDPRASLARMRFRDLQEEQESKKISNTFGRDSQALKMLKSIQTKRGIFIALLILLVFAGATAFFLGRTPDDKRLLDLGKQQLATGQYAFAVQTLSKAAALRKDDPNVYLALARAYIGVDQLSEAWDCITQAQQLGVGVIADPVLASELANYYKQHGQLEKAIDLLRPLVNASLPGKKAELADLDAMRGDDCIEQGKLDEAKRLWEEVERLNEGVRSTEAKSRLATIYLKLVDIAYSGGDDAKALNYLNKLNTLEENARNYLLAADICEHGGKISEAIDQVQKALKLTADDQSLKNKLAQLYMRQGKDLIRSGDTDGGYAYFQQANLLNESIGYPAVALKNLNIKASDGKAKIAGEIWNPNNKSLNSLTLKIQLSDDARGLTVWQKEQRIIDDFEPPLLSQQTKSFSFLAPLPVHGQQNMTFNVYMDGILYNSYPIGTASKLPLNNLQDQITTKEINTSKPLEEKSFKRDSISQIKHNDKQTSSESQTVITEDSKSKPANIKSATKNNDESESTSSAEEKTMKDLEY